MLHRRLVIFGQEFCLAAGQCGDGAPTKDTEGCVGVTYMDAGTKEMYICTKCENGVYTWEPFTSGTGTFNSVTDDGNGNVTIETSLAVSYDEAGNVSLDYDDEEGNVTLC